VLHTIESLVANRGFQLFPFLSETFNIALGQ
jgi:hypothetical protein